MTTSWVVDEPCVGPASEFVAATDEDVPVVPDPGLLVDVELASTLEPNEPADVAVPGPWVDVLTGCTVVESLAGQLVTSGPQLVIVTTSVVYTIPPWEVAWGVELLLIGYGALDEDPGFSERLLEAPVGSAEIGAEAPVPTLLVKDVVLCVVLLSLVAEPEGMNDAVGPV